MRCIIILTIGVMGFSGCKKDGGSNTSPLEVTVEVSPESPMEGETVIIAVSATGADETVEARYTLSHDSMPDSVIERTLSPENGTIEDELEIQRVKAGDYTLVYSLSDQQASEDIKDGAVTITVLPEPNADASFDIATNDELHIKQSISFEFSVSDPDGISQVVLLELPDSTVYSDLNSEAFTQTFTREFDSAQDYTVTLKATDLKGRVQQEEFEFSIITPEDAPAELSVEPQQDNLYTFTTLTFDISAVDADGIERVVVVESEADSLIFEDISGTQFSEQVERTFESPRTYELTIRLTDGEGNKYSQTFAFEILRPGDEPTQFALGIPGGRVGDELSWSFSATDSQGIEQAVAKYVRKGQTDSTEVPLTISGETAEGSAQVTPSETGTYMAVMRITDGQQNTREESKEAQIYAPLAERTLIVDAGFEGIDVSLTLGTETQSGSTNSGGTFSATFTAPEDSLMDYALEADALGLLKLSEQGQNSGDETLDISPEKIPITIASSLPGQYPGEEKTHDIADLVTVDDPEQGSVPVELTFSYSGANFDLSSDGTLYMFTPTKNETGVVEDFNLSVTAPFDNSAQGIVTKEIFAPRDIQFLQTSFSTVEKDSVIIDDLRSILGSEAEITTASVSGASTGLEVITQGEWGVVLKPTEDLSNETRNYTFSINAQNIDGQDESQQGVLAVESLPEFSATVVDHVHEQAVGKAYMIIEGLDNAILDSVVVNGGVFSSVEMPSEAQGYRFGELRNDRPFALEHRIFPQENENHIVPVANRDKVDYWKTVIGTFTEDEIMRSWADTEITWGHGGFAGFNFNLDGNPGGYFLNRLPEFKNTANGQPEQVIVAKNLETHYYVDGELVIEHDSLTQQALDAIIDIYDNEFRVINPKLSPLNIQENVVYKYFDLEENMSFILPLSKDSDPFGTVNFSATRESLTNLYGNIQHNLIEIKSGTSTEPSVQLQRAIIYAEGVPAFLARGRVPAYNSSPDETATNDNFGTSNVIANEIFGGQETGVKALDVWRSHLANSKLYQQAPNGGRYSNAAIIPQIWNPDYQSLKTFCKDIDRLNDWCDDPDPYN